MKGDRPEEIGQLLGATLPLADRRLSPGAPWYICSPTGKTFADFEQAIARVGWHHAQTLVWVKSRPGCNGRRPQRSTRRSEPEPSCCNNCCCTDCCTTDHAPRPAIKRARTAGEPRVYALMTVAERRVACAW
jgi:hypothetical protein